MNEQRESVVDSHVHFWDPRTFDYDWLNGNEILDRPFLPADIPTSGLPVDRLIVVQADCDAGQGAGEVAWLEALAVRGSPISGIVAHASLERGAAVASELAERAASPLVVGIRRLIQDEPDGFAITPDFIAGVRLLARYGLVMDLCVRPHQIDEVTRLVEQCPDVTFVLDHLGKPEVGGDSVRMWAIDVARLAALPNVNCKLSGLSSEASDASRRAADFVPILGFAVELFGPSRCMFGSDWPVSSTTMAYGAWLDVVENAIADLNPEQRRQVMSQTALNVYGRVMRSRVADEPRGHE